MIKRTVIWAKMLMREKCLMMWYSFTGKGINPLQVTTEAMKTEEFSWLDLPTEMVELIISKLPYSDCPKFSCVCKSWSSIMHTLPSVYPVGKCPLLLNFETIDSGVIEYYSPHLNKTFQLDLPIDVKGYEIISAKDGFVLIYNGLFEMKMINPFGGQIIDLPGLMDSISFRGGAAFGLLDGYYVVFLIDWTNENEVDIHVYDRYPLEGWKVNIWLDNNKPFCMAPLSNPVYCDGCFYCLGSDWNLGIFDYLRGTWSIVDVEFKMKKKKNDRDCMTAYSYLVESGGSVIAAQIERNGTGIRMFCLDRENMVWEEFYDLGDLSLYVGSRMSMMSVPTMVKNLGNKVFVPRFRGEQKKIVVKLRQSHRLLYFESKFLISSKENDDDTGSICSYNMANWKKSEHFGSTEMSSCIWFQPFYHGIYLV